MDLNCVCEAPHYAAVLLIAGMPSRNEAASSDNITVIMDA
jgi:hypothetical protein